VAGRGQGWGAAESDLKELMADVTRAMEKAQEAVARIAYKGADATGQTEAVCSPSPPS
jgi:hypothetical protein